MQSGIESKVDEVELEVFNTQKNVEYKVIKDRFSIYTIVYGTK